MTSSTREPGAPGPALAERTRSPVWTVVTVLGVVVVAALGVVTTARVGAVALAVLIAGCAAARAFLSEPGPTAISVRTRRVDVMVLGVLAVALGALAVLLPAS